MTQTAKYAFFGLMFLFMSIPGFAKEGAFFGKYKAVVDHDFFGEVALEFLLNAKDEIRPLKIKENEVWEEASSTDTFVKRSQGFNTLGPSVPHLTVGFSYGSDEDGMESYVTFAWLGHGGIKELTVLSSMTLYEDGPNEFSSVFKDNVALYKWNKEKNSYEKLP
jgi:hypothetical protein